MEKNPIIASSFFFFYVPSSGQRLKHLEQARRSVCRRRQREVQSCRRAPTRTHQNKSPETSGQEPDGWRLRRRRVFRPGSPSPRRPSASLTVKMRSNLAKRRERSRVFPGIIWLFRGDKAQLISGPGGSGWLIIQRCGRRERRAGLKSSPTLEARRRRNRCSSSLVLFYFIYSITACNRSWGPVFPVQLRTRVLIRSAIESINHSIFIHSRLNHIQRAPTAQSPKETRSVLLSQTSPSTCFDVPAN